MTFYEAPSWLLQDIQQESNFQGTSKHFLHKYGHFNLQIQLSPCLFEYSVQSNGLECFVHTFLGLPKICFKFKQLCNLVDQSFMVHLTIKILGSAGHTKMSRKRSPRYFSNFHPKFCRCFYLLNCHCIRYHTVFGALSKFACSASWTVSFLSQNWHKEEILKIMLFPFENGKVIKKTGIATYKLTCCIIWNEKWFHLHRYIKIWLRIFHIKKH